MITRDADGHVFVDGVRYPGVNTILTQAGLGADYSAVPPAVLARARCRGLHVDDACTLLDEGRLDWALVADEAKPYVKAWQRFVEETKFTPRIQQPLGIHEDHRYCGIPDVIGTTPEHTWVIDRKATADVRRTYGLQLAAYTMPGMHYRDANAGEGMVIVQGFRRAVVHLLKTGKYTVYNDADHSEIFTIYDWDVFRWAVAGYRENGKRR